MTQHHINVCFDPANTFQIPGRRPIEFVNLQCDVYSRRVLPRRLEMSDCLLFFPVSPIILNLSLVFLEEEPSELHPLARPLNLSISDLAQRSHKLSWPLNTHKSRQPYFASVSQTVILLTSTDQLLSNSIIQIAPCFCFPSSPRS